MTSRPRDPSRHAGRTTPAQGETDTPEKVPRLPHERDESADSQERGEASGKKVGEQAHKDLERGLVDTSKSTEMDRVYRQVKSGK
jgi:hypothetical protein